MISLRTPYIFVRWTNCECLTGISGEGNGTPLQYSCLENPMDGGAWWAAVHGVARSQTQLSDFTFTFYSHALEKEMASHSSVLAWRIPGTREPGGLPSMGSHRVGQDWSDLAAVAIGIWLYKGYMSLSQKLQVTFYTKLSVETMSIKLDIVTIKYELSKRREVINPIMLPKCLCMHMCMWAHVYIIFDVVFFFWWREDIINKISFVKILEKKFLTFQNFT